MPLIVESYRKQTVPIEIWMVNNGGNFESFGADRLISIPWNAGEMARYLFTRRAETDLVCFQDDDFLITGEDYIERAIDILDRMAPEACVGVAGRHVNLAPPHYAGEARPDSYTNFLKGHFQIFRRKSLGNVKIGYHPYASDLQFSLDISRGRDVHWVSAELKERTMRLPTHGAGLEFRPEHWQEREEACIAYIEEYGFDA